MSYRIYISGPITGKKHYETAFGIAEDKLIERGWEPVNPANLKYVITGGATHEEYMKVCMELLEMCDAIYMLKGWEDSKGAKMELEYAKSHGFTVHIEGERCLNT